MNPAIESIRLEIDGQHVTGIRQRDVEQSDQPTMLCTHGWLDNANSFVPLMPYLPAFDLVAIDLPGHGYSDPLEAGYSLHEMTYQLSRVMDALAWDNCHLLGHSLGAGLTMMLAIAQPERIQSLTMIESCGPLSEPAEKLPERLGRALQDRRDMTKFKSRIYASKDEAVATRLRAAKMHKASASLIINRQVENTEGGYQWRFDARWRMASPQYLTEEQVLAILASLECPVLNVVAEDGYLTNRPETEGRLRSLQHGESVVLSGNHHLHMDTPEPVAAAINRFLKTTPALY
ncbi:MAG: alpha/beta fold hydrolase [Granulosicoccus sp.]